MLHDTGDGTILNISRRSRRATAAIRCAVRARDGVRSGRNGSVPAGTFSQLRQRSSRNVSRRPVHRSPSRTFDG